MPRLHLGLVLHNHQPVGNYGFVIDDVYRHAYEPMLAALERHPGVRVALHTSGCLFDWIEVNRPEYIARLRALCDRGQVEMLTGGYYEPVLPMIPDGDKLGQIRKLSEYIERRFSQRATGCWLTERVWEPSLPAPLAEAGVVWTLVDDAHFRMAGMREDQLDGYFVTEDQGKRVALFAGSQRLRYIIPWRNVENVIVELREIAESARSEAPYIVLGDDGEKFGAWPTTYAHVWGQGWIESFFSALEEQGDWLELITPGDYLARFEARGLTYLPTASYAEMMEWAMPAESSANYRRLVEAAEEQGREEVRFMRGGFWRYFLAKYPEANAMHKRGLRIDAKIGRVHAPEAREALWAAQCNCPYWHGVFGGLYLRHIRAATNANLVRAERLADEAVGQRGVRVERADLDFDGHEEILAQTPAISLMVHPALGGMVSELDLRRRDHAVLDVLARRREAYHDALLAGASMDATSEATNIHGAVRVKEEGLVAGLVFDRHRRGGLQEWLLPVDADVGAFARGAVATYFEPEGRWEVEAMQRSDTARVAMRREHAGWRIEKVVEVANDDERIDVRYAITNASEEARMARFVSEWNISSPQAPDGDDRVASLETNAGDVELPCGPNAVTGVRRALIRGSAAWAVECEMDAPCDVWSFPVESVSSSEGGVERVLQGFSISMTRAIELAPGETEASAFTLRAVE